MVKKEAKQPYVIASSLRTASLNEQTSISDHSTLAASAANPTYVAHDVIKRAKANPASLTPADIMALQRTIGNQSVKRLLGSNKKTDTTSQNLHQSSENARSVQRVLIRGEKGQAQPDAVEHFFESSGYGHLLTQAHKDSLAGFCASTDGKIKNLVLVPPARAEDMQEVLRSIYYFINALEKFQKQKQAVPNRQEGPKKAPRPVDELEQLTDQDIEVFLFERGINATTVKTGLPPKLEPGIIDSYSSEEIQTAQFQVLNNRVFQRVPLQAGKYLYHVTTFRNLANIVKNGLQFRFGGDLERGGACSLDPDAARRAHSIQYSAGMIATAVSRMTTATYLGMLEDKAKASNLAVDCTILLRFKNQSGWENRWYKDPVDERALLLYGQNVAPSYIECLLGNAGDPSSKDNIWSSLDQIDLATLGEMLVTNELINLPLSNPNALSLEDAFFVLNLEPTASNELIRNTYKKLALQWHPDKAQEQEKAKAEAKFKLLLAAIERIKDEKAGNKSSATLSIKSASDKN